MEKRYPPFVESLKTTDPELFEVVAKNMDLALAPGELDAKTKTLIVLALDAMAGAPEGVRSLAARARELGVTEGQIAEALRLAYMVSANQTLVATRAAY